MAGVIAGSVGLVAWETKPWFISTSVIASAAAATALAGAAVDGIYTTWYSGLKTCVYYNGMYMGDSLYPLSTGVGGWQWTGSDKYILDSLMCSNTLTGNGASTTQIPVDNLANNLPSSLTSASSGGSGGIPTSGYMYPGPFYWTVAQNMSTTATIPKKSFCFCKLDTPGKSTQLNYNWDYTNNQPGPGFNAYSNCAAIQAGFGYTCANVTKDGYNFFAASTAFCMLCFALTVSLAVYSGLATVWVSRAHGDEALLVGKAIEVKDSNSNKLGLLGSGLEFIPLPPPPPPVV
jgi:hypothetical protein